MPKYSNIEEVRNDLKVHQLERQIAVEQLKRTGNSIKEFSALPTNLVSAFFSGKYARIIGLVQLIRRLF